MGTILQCFHGVTSIAHCISFCMNLIYQREEIRVPITSPTLTVMLGRYQYRVLHTRALFSISIQSIYFLKDQYLERLVIKGKKGKIQAGKEALLTEISLFLFSAILPKKGTRVSFKFGLKKVKHNGIQKNKHHIWLEHCISLFPLQLLDPPDASFNKSNSFQASNPIIEL